MFYFVSRVYYNYGLDGEHRQPIFGHQSLGEDEKGDLSAVLLFKKSLSEFPSHRQLSTPDPQSVVWAWCWRYSEKDCKQHEALDIYCLKHFYHPGVTGWLNFMDILGLTFGVFIPIVGSEAEEWFSVMWILSMWICNFSLQSFIHPKCDSIFRSAPCRLSFYFLHKVHLILLTWKFYYVH